ncbi:hypothetical protein [Pelagibius sp.]|uniref:hypothetical protein n=1 Tax=Pelagibius sp. TaxID=1931238 RepID=UPI00261777F4|nr:hypothetical protein [Pelagibius sp.]
MSAASPHSKIINAVARAKLRPLGIQQKGRSRVWYDDRRWHGILIEFQPSGFSKMSSLNVAVAWFWYPKEHWSFDWGKREPGWAEFDGDEAQFQRDFEVLADAATEAVNYYRARTGTLREAYEGLLENHKQFTRPGGWPDVHLGMLAALNGQCDQAEKLLSYVANEEGETKAYMSLKRFCNQAIAHLGNPESLRTWVEGNIAECRSLRRLPPLDPPTLPSS